MLRVGLIGAGFMGSMHSSCYQVLENVKLTAVCDAVSENSEKIAKIHNAVVFKDAYELIASEDIDAVDICLPTYLHTRYAEEAMKNGKAVFIEKPVCMSEDEAQLLLDTQRETGAVVMVGQAIRFWDEYVWAKQEIDSGKYGKVLSAVLKRVSPLPTWAWDNWLHNPEQSGSVAMDMHIHDVDYIRCILGEPKTVQSTAVRNQDGVISQIFSSYTFKDGAVATSEACWDYPSSFPFCMELRVKLEDATIVYDSTASFTVYLKDGGSFTPELENSQVSNSQTGGNISSLGGYYNEINYFIKHVTQNQPIEEATLEDAVKSLKLTLREISISGGVVLG